MSRPDPSELKKLLRKEGFEIYRTQSTRVLLAERVRANLIMDSGVAAEEKDGSYLIHVTLKAQASHFPGADEDRLRQHARELTHAFLDLGFDEQESLSRRVEAPSDPEQTLDTTYEVHLQRPIFDISSLFEELRRALSLKRSTGED